MTDKITKLAQRIRALDNELEEEFERRRNSFNYRIEQRRVIFEQDVQRQHAAFKKKLLPYIAGANPLVILTAPVIYSMIVPFALLDLFVSIYQAICFPVYQIEKVKRSDYIAFDRKQLSYLNILEKFNCVYCSYGNGLLGYSREIAARTEKRWCPIKHAKRMAENHSQYPDFFEYGDAQSYENRNPPPSPSDKE